MKAIDYSKFLEPDHVADSGLQVLASRELYGDHRGIEYRYDMARGKGRQEAVGFDNELFLIAGDVTPCPPGVQRQVVTDGDWIHIQFRAGGRAREVLPQGGFVQTDPYSCVITRYPQGSVIDRETEAADHFRAACLYFRPSVLRTLMPGTSDLFAADWAWLHEDAFEGPRSVVFRMSTPEVIAINDVFACSYRSDIRRNYMYAKSLELLSHVANRLCKRACADAPARLSDADRGRIARCREILDQHMDEQLTLEQLGRRIGVNRSKLAMGFKLIYGTSLQAYWRELRLCRARDLLSSSQASVTDVAAAVGYAEISCLTRAYHKRFGHLPKDAKSGND